MKDITTWKSLFDLHYVGESVYRIHEKFPNVVSKGVVTYMDRDAGPNGVGKIKILFKFFDYVNGRATNTDRLYTKEYTSYLPNDIFFNKQDAYWTRLENIADTMLLLPETFPRRDEAIRLGVDWSIKLREEMFKP